MDLGLRGRTALVTGAAGGIGRAVAVVLAAEGMQIALADREASAVTEAAAELARTGAATMALTVDVTAETEVAAAVQAVVEHWGGLDVLVGCAGVSGPVGTPLSRTTRAQWDGLFAVNVTGAFLTLKHATSALRASPVASVVFLASDSALVATAGMVPYCASKAALLQLVRAAAVELADDGIRINAVCPSIVDTPMSRGDLGLTDGFETESYPAQTATEVAAQVAFLCSVRSRAISATAIVSDFGSSARSNFPA